MAEIDLDDRASLERLYPLDAFEHDGAQNSLANAAVRHGLRIMSGPDSAGHVAVTRARQQVAERDPEGDTIFLAPQAATEGAGDGSRGVAPGQAETAPSGPDPHAYRAFIDGVIATARSAKFKTPLGRDERLRGFHGG